ncbi:MAG TPA: alpha/beta fold hydrolase [Anaeromyxobacter sp.]|nr:alpha/beta fold hydrolase [Anaeromyxobacter sp.]
MRIARRHVTIPASPVAPGRPAEILVRDAGEGPAVILLHGGWGYEAYPFDLAAIAARHRVVAPDRVGYGGSGILAELPGGHHRAMAEETLLVLDALGIERAAFWGHSDGAIIAAWLGFLAPGRVRALVLEALHFLAAKPGSVEFFRTARDAPERFGPRFAEAFERDHGARWREVLGACGRAWLSIIAQGMAGRPDLFDGRFGEIRAPTLLLHGTRDPRTEPGELAAAQRALPEAKLALVDAAHCPHASEKVGADATRIAVEFLEANLT